MWSLAGVPLVQFTVQTINRNCSGVGVEEFRGKFQSCITEIIKKPEADMGCSFGPASKFGSHQQSFQSGVLSSSAEAPNDTRIVIQAGFYFYQYFAVSIVLKSKQLKWLKKKNST